MKQLISCLVVVMTIFYILGVAGGLENELMTLGQACARWAVSLIVLVAASRWMEGRKNVD